MLDWTKFDPYGSTYARGKNCYYVILVRGVPENRPEDCIIELYTSLNEMTISKIHDKKSAVRLVSRSVVLGDLSSERNIAEAIEGMKAAAVRRENRNPYSSLSSAYKTS